MLRIFLADHHVLIRGGLRSLLRARRDFSVCGEADNGIDAVKLVIQSKPDIAIMNVNMPGINGIEATRQIRKASPETEILIFTAEDNEDIMRECLRAGAGGYLLHGGPLTWRGPGRVPTWPAATQRWIERSVVRRISSGLRCAAQVALVAVICQDHGTGVLP